MVVQEKSIADSLWTSQCLFMAYEQRIGHVYGTSALRHDHTILLKVGTELHY